MKLCLGTVQQGLEYGINNKYGKPSKEYSQKIFYEAVKHGITMFDTARAYGDAELLLGEYLKEHGNRNEIKIISKLRPNILEGCKDIYDTICRECEGTLKRIGVESLDGYLLDTPEYIRDPKVVSALLKLKEEGYASHIGVSIYNIEDGDVAINTGAVDYIQLPFSIFDQRGKNSGFLRRAKEAKITVFARSIFLQGLYFMDAGSLPEKVKRAEPMLRNWELILEERHANREEVLIEFVKQSKEIDYLVFGVDTVEQLQRDISVFESESKLDETIWNIIGEKFSDVEESIIIPSLWAKQERKGK